MKTLVIVPAFNEAAMIERVVDGIHETISDADVLVVDDGSRDATAALARKAGALVVTHILNRGLGGSIGTGLSFAKIHDYDFAVTFDGDGQHSPNDIRTLLQLLYSKAADVVIGSRLISEQASMPWDRRILNTVANWLTWLLFGVVTTDSQSGFRGFNKRAIQSLRLQTDRMEVSSEIFGEIKRLRLRYAEVPIEVIYTDYSRQKGQRNSNAVAIFYKLVLRLFR